MDRVFEVFWIFVPAMFANAAPPFWKLIFPKWATPMDFGYQLFGKRIFGDHKTIRGLILSALLAQIIFLFQLRINSDYIINLPIYYGLLIGFVALFGDALKSLVKRQLNIAPGVAWFPFDQIDWIISSLLIILLLYPIDYLFIFIAFIMGFVLHLISKVVGFLIGINNKPI